MSVRSPTTKAFRKVLTPVESLGSGILPPGRTSYWRSGCSIHKRPHKPPT